MLKSHEPLPREETLKIHIHPGNRQILVTSPEYIEAWAKALEAERDEIEGMLREKVAKGEIEIPVAVPAPGATLGTAQAMSLTPEAALHFQAHALAVESMQNWALMRGVGLPDGASVSDHGRLIEYVDSPNVPLLGYEIEEAA